MPPLPKPHSIRHGKIRTKKLKFEDLGPIAKRHGRFPKGTILPETRVLACPRVKMSDLPEGHIPPEFYGKNLEYNQQARPCCRHPENHEVSAYKSHPDEPFPDQFVFHCACGKNHHVFLCGAEHDHIPMWSA